MNLDTENIITWAKRVLPVFVVVLIVSYCCYTPSAKWDGTVAPDVPVQTNNDLPPPFAHGEYTITPLANYSISAVVLRRENYRFDATADLSPIDLALGWGPMSIASNINSLSITQSNRFYYYKWNDKSLISGRDIAVNSANTHCIPADKNVKKILSSVRQYDLVDMQGYLISASRKDGYQWFSSLTRNDTGNGACEIFWITSISRSKP